MSSHHSWPAICISVPEGHVALVLLQEAASSFYLQIPLNIIGSLCLKPRKYLLFLGWCIFGVEGVLARQRHGRATETDGNLVDRGIYHYLVAGGLSLFSFTIPLLHAGHLRHAICPMKISSLPSTSRLSKPGHTNLRRRVTYFAIICWGVISFVCGQEWSHRL